MLNKTRAPWMGLWIGLALFTAAPAGALTITVDSVATTGSNTADGKVDSLGSNLLGETGSYSENRSSLSTLNAGGSVADTIGASVSAATRYAAVLAADTGQNNSISRTAVSSYTITFTVTADPGTVYDLSIDTSRIGALTRIDDTNTSRVATYTMGAVSGTVNSVLDGSLALGALGFTNESINSDKNTPFSQSSNLVLTGLTGTQSITLGFAWTSFVQLPNATAATGNDEIAVRLGMAGTQTTRVSAENYPGAGARDINGDGHFVTIDATVVSVIPEPGTVLLLGTGLAGLAASRKRA